MPIDPSIALQVRGVQLEDPVAVQANALALRNAQAQNAMQRYSIARAQREDEEANALARAYESARNPDGTIDRNRLMASAPGRAIPNLQKGFAEQDRSDADVGAKRLDTMKKQLEIVGGTMSAVRRNPTRQSVMSALTMLHQQGLPMVDRAIASLPQDDAQIAGWVDQVIFGTEQGLKSLEAIQPKVSYQDAGGTRVAVNQNALAGPVGPMSNVAPIAVTQTPDSRAADARSAASLSETRRHNLATEKLQGDAAARAAGQVPASLIEKMAQNNVTISKIDEALAEVRARPESFGLWNYLPDAVRQRTDKEGVRGRALVADIAGQRIHDRSGAAVTVGEAERLKPYIPNREDDPDVVATKLEALQKEYQMMQEELAAGKSIVEVTRRQNAARGKVKPAPPKGQVFDSMPDPAQHNGRTITDTDTGMKYRSDGSRWVRAS